MRCWPCAASPSTWASLGAHRRLPKPKPWVVPRTPDGKPDLQGNWTNETQTPLERMGKQGATLTTEEAAAIESRAKSLRGVPRQGQRSQSAAAAQGRRDPQPDGAGRTVVHRADRRSRGRRSRRLQRLLARSGQQRHQNRRRRRAARSSSIRPTAALPPLTAEGKQRLSRTRRARRRNSASSIIPRCGRCPIAACCRSGRTPARRCCRTTSTTTTTRSCRRRIT